MELLEISVERFRNLSLKNIEFLPSVNLVVGANGVGKTSLLEAVVVLGNLRSFREPSLRRAVRQGQTSFQITGSVRSHGRTRRLSLTYEVDSPPRRRLFVDGVEMTVDKYLQLFPIFAVTGPDRELVNGGPEGRRALLDRFVFLLRPAHIEDLRAYRRALKQRNAALSAGATDAELGAWEAPLAAAASRVITARAESVRRLALNFSTVSEYLTGEGFPDLTMEYRGDPWCDLENSPEKVEETYQQRYNETRTRDRQMGYTGDGPHRHDLNLRTNGRSIRFVLSTGQAKIVAAGLRLSTLAEIEKERRDLFPVIVDDVDAELDREALARLVSYLGDKRQIFLSSTSATIAAAGGRQVQHLWLENGACVRQEAETDE